MVVPDNVLFADGVGQELRTWLMDLCNLHTILRLPTGIFLFARRQNERIVFSTWPDDNANTRSVWIYDLRADQPPYRKTRPLKSEDFVAFRKAYGADALGADKRRDQGFEGRFRVFSRKEIRERRDNLDISWLRATDETAEEALDDPEDIAEAIREHLQRAMTTMTTLAGDIRDRLEVDSGVGSPGRMAQGDDGVPSWATWAHDRWRLG